MPCEGAVHRVVNSGNFFVRVDARAPVRRVRIRTANATTVALIAPDTAPDGHPETSLRHLTCVGAVATRAGWVAVWLPNIRRFPAFPLGQFAIDRIPWFGVDEVTVRPGARMTAKQTRRA